MQLTRIRFATSATFATFAGLAVATGACGQVTGLSNDYLFDVQEDGGTALDGGGDATTEGGSRTDAPTDAPVDTGADAATCSFAQAQSTQLRMTQLSGASGCKQCLANDCCTDVDSCLNTSECKRALSCRLDCTTMTGADRHSCFQACSSNSGGNTTPASYTSGVGACATSACAASTACSFL